MGDCDSGLELEVDLINQVIHRPDGRGKIHFDVDHFRKNVGLCLCLSLSLSLFVTSCKEWDMTDILSLSLSISPCKCLINGLDDIGLTLQKEEKIKAFEEVRDRWYPFLNGIGYGHLETSHFQKSPFGK